MNALERLKEEYWNASRTEITDSSAGYSAGLRFTIRVLEEDDYGVAHLRRPTKPVFPSHSLKMTYEKCGMIWEGAMGYVCGNNECPVQVKIT